MTAHLDEMLIDREVVVMMLRTESDFIKATNQSYDLSLVVTTYLTHFKNYVNGYNEVRIPDYEFVVTFHPSKKEGTILVALHWTDVRRWTETLYYDVDSDYFVESMGGESNACGEVSHSEDYPNSKELIIPINHLMMGEKEMLAYFVNLKAKIAADKAEKERVDEMNKLEKRLKELKGDK